MLSGKKTTICIRTPQQKETNRIPYKGNIGIAILCCFGVLKQTVKNLGHKSLNLYTLSLLKALEPRALPRLGDIERSLGAHRAYTEPGFRV